MGNLNSNPVVLTYPQRNLCGRRYDNAQPFSGTSNGLPHTCFEDVVLSPLATWVLLALLGGLVLPAVLRERKRGADAAGRAPLHRYRRVTARRSRLVGSLAFVYTLLLVASLLMNVLEIVRLYLAHRGAGLLPFTLAAIVIAILALHVPLPTTSTSSAAGASPPASSRVLLSLSLFVFWSLSLAFDAVKVASLIRLKPVEPRDDTEYLNYDQVLDLEVIVALYALAVLVEGGRLVAVVRRSLRGDETSTAGRLGHDDDVATPSDEAAATAKGAEEDKAER